MAVRDAVIFLQGNSMQQKVMNKHKVLLGDANLLYPSTEKGGSYDKLYRHTLAVMMPGLADENSGLEVTPRQRDRCAH